MDSDYSNEDFKEIDEILDEIDQIELKHDEKSHWIEGTVCEIYSHSLHEWFRAEIIKLFKDGEEECVVAKFNENMIKEIRLYSENIRPVTKAAADCDGRRFEDNEFSLNDLSTLPILVTGGAGYIGSHTIIELINNGFSNIIILDNFLNSSTECIARIRQITKDKKSQIVYYNIDIARERQRLQTIVCKHKPYVCIHFAALKSVGESVEKSLLYYQNNMVSTINLMETLHKYSCHNIIFSSSCTVYGNNQSNVVPLNEKSIVGVNLVNPYAKTKYFVEEILKDFASNNKHFKVVILRYFNPIGAHKSGLIGEDPDGIPNNLMPYILRVAMAQNKKDCDKPFYNKYCALNIFGNDYKTSDGTGVRDYIHVVDVATGHLNALLYDIMDDDDNNNNVSIYNLGTGQGTSVLELKKCMEKACGFNIPHIIKNRRRGDVDKVYADCSFAKKAIKWIPRFDINAACKDAWNWQLKNPYGFKQKNTKKEE